MVNQMSLWLMKSEPADYAWEQLVIDCRAKWGGVRNHQAAAYMREMCVGDEAFFYHSHEDLAIMGIMKIAKKAYPDPEDPTGRFVIVDVVPVCALERPVTLREIKADKILRELAIVRQPRLSVMPVSLAAWKRVLALEKAQKC